MVHNKICYDLGSTKSKRAAGFGVGHRFSTPMAVRESKYYGFIFNHFNFSFSTSRLVPTHFRFWHWQKRRADDYEKRTLFFWSCSWSLQECVHAGKSTNEKSWCPSRTGLIQKQIFDDRNRRPKVQNARSNSQPIWTYELGNQTRKPWSRTLRKGYRNQQNGQLPSIDHLKLAMCQLVAKQVEVRSVKKRQHTSTRHL